jgi:hypothetical protein
MCHHQVEPEFGEERLDVHIVDDRDDSREAEPLTEHSIELFIQWISVAIFVSHASCYTIRPLISPRNWKE